MHAASRTLVYHGYDPDPDDKEGWALLAQMKPTHVAVGINSPVYADRYGVYTRMPWVLRGGLVAERVHELGAVLVLWVWATATNDFIEDAAEDLCVLGERWSAGADLWNAELPWVGHPAPTPIVTRHWRDDREIQQRARIARLAWEADHDLLTARLMDVRREHGRGEVDFWACVADRLPPATLDLVRAGTGLVSQMQAVEGKTPPSPQRQQKAWQHIEKRIKRPSEDYVIFGQQAPYGLSGGDFHAARKLRLGCDAHLARARTLSEAGLAFFDLHQIRRNPWAVPVIRSYSPRVNSVHPRWRP